MLLRYVGTKKETSPECQTEKGTTTMKLRAPVVPGGLH